MNVYKNYSDECSLATTNKSRRNIFEYKFNFEPFAFSVIVNNSKFQEVDNLIYRKLLKATLMKSAEMEGKKIYGNKDVIELYIIILYNQLFAFSLNT